MQITLRDSASKKVHSSSPPMMDLTIPESSNLTRSLTKKISRKFTLRTKKSTSEINTSSSASIKSDSDSSAPSTPRSHSAQEFSRPASPSSTNSSVSTIKVVHMAREASCDSVYGSGYGSGQYAVNLEDLYSSQSGRNDRDESQLSAQGLQKFSVQEYISLL